MQCNCTIHCIYCILYSVSVICSYVFIIIANYIIGVDAEFVHTSMRSQMYAHACTYHAVSLTFL